MSVASKLPAQQRSRGSAPCRGLGGGGFVQ